MSRFVTPPRKVNGENGPSRGSFTSPRGKNKLTLEERFLIVSHKHSNSNAYNTRKTTQQQMLKRFNTQNTIKIDKQQLLLEQANAKIDALQKAFLF